MHFLGYDAVISKNKRQAPNGILKSEDQELTPDQRRKLVSSARDLRRNFTIAGWMIRKHLDYVSTFSFRCKTKNAELNNRVEKLMKVWSKAANCDVAGRHSLPHILRLAEASRTIDGDVLILRLADGRLQAIEGDRVRTPPGGIPSGVGVAPINIFDFSHGVKTDLAGKALQYIICRRGKANDFSTAAGMFYFERLLSAENVWHHGYFDRFDQIRGIAPLTAAINSLRDVYEGCDYALAKMKVSQLFALALFRNSDDGIGNPTPTDEDESGFQVDFGKGPVQLDLEGNDKAEFLESKSPSIEFQQFSQTVIAMALKGLDIPFSFYSENFTNFSGQRQAWIQYDLSARNKRRDNIDLLDAITRWRLELWIEDGDLPGVDVEEVEWEWMPTGVPWIDPLKEVAADTQAVAAGFTSRTRVCREKGEDFFEIADEIAAENEYLASKGLETAIQVANVQIAEVTPSNAV